MKPKLTKSQSGTTLQGKHKYYTDTITTSADIQLVPIQTQPETQHQQRYKCKSRTSHTVMMSHYE